VSAEDPVVLLAPGGSAIRVKGGAVLLEPATGCGRDAKTSAFFSPCATHGRAHNAEGLGWLDADALLAAYCTL